MPTLTIGGTTVQVAAGTRLVNAIEDAGVAIGHRCGGNARCTSCRVAFVSGEPSAMNATEQAKLTEKGFLGQYRLSCQITVDHDMSVIPQMTLETVPDWSDTGPRCTDTIEQQ